MKTETLVKIKSTGQLAIIRKWLGKSKDALVETVNPYSLGYVSKADLERVKLS